MCMVLCYKVWGDLGPLWSHCGTTGKYVMYVWLHAIVHLVFDQEVATVDVQKQFESPTINPRTFYPAHGTLDADFLVEWLWIIRRTCVSNRGLLQWRPAHKPLVQSTHYGIWECMQMFNDSLTMGSTWKGPRLIVWSERLGRLGS